MQAKAAEFPIYVPEIQIHRGLAFQASEAGTGLGPQGLPSDHHLPTQLTHRWLIDWKI